MKKFYVLESQIVEILKEKKLLNSLDEEGNSNYITLKEAHYISGLKPATWWKRINDGNAIGEKVDGVWYVRSDQVRDERKVQGRYGYTDVAKEFGKHPGSIRHLERRGIVSHSVAEDGSKYFTSQDIATLRDHYSGVKKTKGESSSVGKKKGKSDQTEVKVRKLKTPRRKQVNEISSEQNDLEKICVDSNVDRVVSSSHRYSYVAELIDAVRSGVQSEYDEKFLVDIDVASHVYSFKGEDEVWKHAKDALCVELSEIKHLFERRSEIKNKDRESLEMFLLLLNKYIVGFD